MIVYTAVIDGQLGYELHIVNFRGKIYLPTTLGGADQLLLLLLRHHLLLLSVFLLLWLPLAAEIA